MTNLAVFDALPAPPSLTRGLNQTSTPTAIQRELVRMQEWLDSQQYNVHIHWRPISFSKAVHKTRAERQAPGSTLDRDAFGTFQRTTMQNNNMLALYIDPNPLNGRPTGWHFWAVACFTSAAGTKYLFIYDSQPRHTTGELPSAYTHTKAYLNSRQLQLFNAIPSSRLAEVWLNRIRLIGDPLVVCMNWLRDMMRLGGTPYIPQPLIMSTLPGFEQHSTTADWQAHVMIHSMFKVEHN